jgi:hypothetical protein
METEQSMEQSEQSLARRSALAYTSISLLVALAFLVIATVMGSYNAVARFGGTAWVFLLSMIVTMPLVTARFKAASQHSHS